jgi:hypothetical protein
MSNPQTVKKIYTEEEEALRGVYFFKKRVLT